RRTSEDVRQPHSLWLQTLAETGVLGILLLLVALVPIVIALRRAALRARRHPAARLFAVGAGGTLVLWLAQDSVDWLHLLPGLSAAALGFAAILLTDSLHPSPPSVGRRPRVRPVVFAVATLAT